MTFRPPKQMGLFAGLIIIGTIVGIAGYLLVSLRQQELGLGLFFMICLFALSVALLVLWVYWFIELLTLRYHLDRNALTIACATGRQVIPLAAIEAIERGDTLKVGRGLKGVGWPGYMKGSLELSTGHGLETFSTEPLERQLIIVSGARRYGISPRDIAGFVTALETHRGLGAVRTIEEQHERARWLLWPVWHDRRHWQLLALGLLLNLALIAWVMQRYGSLPGQIPLHFDVGGQADRIAPREQLFTLPAIGLLVFVLNTVTALVLYARERLAAYLLGFGSLGVQAVLWLATLEILSR